MLIKSRLLIPKIFKDVTDRYALTADTLTGQRSVHKEMKAVG